MRVHKFTCGHGHVFFLPLGLPKPADEMAKLLNEITCPYCQIKFPLEIHAQEMKVEVAE
ncbi:hypothetical protein MKY34_16900 [Sporosarcina sp. FSL K6-1522]|uniref:hypothetical protein n=1 Tax=Sporosarcina sp. FSL K6-1522 TaxID=2921554 RepID=UPI003159AB0B